MQNIYCRNSKLSSLCVRVLMECYVAGSTAEETRAAIGGRLQPPWKGARTQVLREPQGEEVQLFNRFLAVYPSRIANVSRFARARQDQRPENWKAMSVSRQTINAYYLRFGALLWAELAEPYLMERALATIELLPQLFDPGEVNTEDVARALTIRLADRYVARANGSVAIARQDPNYGDTLEYLTERATRSNGLHVRRAREHISWAMLLSSVRKQTGHDDRCKAAQLIAQLAANHYV